MYDMQYTIHVFYIYICMYVSTTYIHLSIDREKQVYNVACGTIIKHLFGHGLYHHHLLMVMTGGFAQGQRLWIRLHP